ncbi:hypothetical protein [Novosphingobium sp. ST904]|uniref:hypothetical protein n=1 Tax=Novosphingobium sp. ST904 TaxID=1684385 RepID=UPI0006C86CEF|nr:hypothetical protein [Novosphingobium sp. ST904]KPH66947.1 hypothetical protein ADT71_03495 [Novosphingobium sp. ST904]TCM25713.1 hypothetical protein EDF59_13925 [Novosphingobium sp. ST904]
MSDTAALDARLENLEAVGRHAGLFKADPEQLAREVAYQDQIIRQWAVDRAIAIGIQPAPLVFKLAQQIFDFIKSGELPAAEKAAD